MVEKLTKADKEYEQHGSTNLQPTLMGYVKLSIDDQIKWST